MSHIRFVLSITAAAALFISLGSVRAHHSLAAEFDVDRTMEISGRITEMKWTNPHAWLYVDVMDAAGQTRNWAVEFASPNQLYRRGWSKEDLPTGASVTVVGYAPRDNSQRVSATEVKLPDGRTLFAGTRQDDQN